ncbi:hypothetical protein BH09PLA1_BH09PLA1_32050 [soil metagenome]
MLTLAEILAGKPLTTLTVRIAGDATKDRTFLALHGMSIGRSIENSIVIEHCDVCPVHARILQTPRSDVLRLYCEHDHFALTLPNGLDVQDVPLNYGLAFSIGQVRFRCGEFSHRLPEKQIDTTSGEIAQSELPPLALPYVPPIRAACPRCHQSILSIAASARFCPHCGLELPENCPPWNGPGEFNLANPALAAYAHALFNLGMRYENTAGGFDLQQAICYYEKAAKIGVPGAKARLEARGVD